ncbi:S8 family serine peptidase [Niallia sp. NCCP-28]|uniref:S8 family serine peptidase n=1 Tax=Niallia sp. NCCP-28 TaxID=2934712 RepID=UPI0028527D39|nr:S8 family serine peptidase [Niallia sp. NCCP-28]
MRKSFLFSIILVFFMCTSNVYAKTFDYPSLPKDNPYEKKIAIVKTKDNYSMEEIEKMLKKHKSLTIRTKFREIFNGFSVEGYLGEIQKLKQEQAVEIVSEVQIYSAEEENPVRLIGADPISSALQHTSKPLTGKGVKIGVIDTGIDYQHPDLRKNFKGGWDFIDKDKYPMETVGKGTKNTLHGTHVAGIIAADGKVKGVAPNAEIIAYRALGPGGTGTTEQILAAIEQAIKDKVDIVNLSLGSEVNGPDLPISAALNKAVEKGIIAVAAAGNSGPFDWTVGSPGTASKAISVGASTPNIQTEYINIDNKKLILNNMKNSAEWKEFSALEVMDGGIGEKENLKNASGKLVLIKRGKITFTEKVKNGMAAGAKAVLIYNNEEGPLMGSLEQELPIPVAGITKKEGLFISEKLKKSPLIVKIETKWEKDILADFSSRGPVTTTWDIKPDVLAPGVVINSTVPGGYMVLQGTSMAAPHVAGACALLLEAHPNWKPEEVKAALMNTAKPIVDRDNNRYKVYEQGAGRIQVDEAIQTNVLVMPGSLRFGKFHLVDQLHEHTAFITIKNVGNKIEKISFGIPKKQAGISWSMPFSFSLQAGETKKLPITMRLDRHVVQNKLQDGTIEMIAGSQKMQIPYLYVLEEPNYPRVMGFELTENSKEKIYEYEVYLPGGAEEFGIALFDKESLAFVQFLDWKKNVGRGLLKTKISPKKFPAPGNYLMIIFAKKSGQEDEIKSELTISAGKK